MLLGSGGPKWNEAEAETAADDADGAVAIVFNGAVSDRILDIASSAAIETVVGTKEGKGISPRDDVKAWLTEKHA